MRMLLLLLGVFFSLNGCKEFYDEEFLDGNNVRADKENANYDVTLSAVDTSLTELAGQAQVVLDGENVTVAIDLSGIPENINQLHYGFVAADCSAFTNVIPVELGSTREYQINEELSRRALDFDVEAGGLDSNSLEGKSLIIKAFSSLTTTVPNASSSYVLACGTLDESAVESVETDDTNPED